MIVAFPTLEVELITVLPNHKLLSGPVVIPAGVLEFPMLSSVIIPAVVIFPKALLLDSVNHRLPSGPEVIS